MKTSKTPKNPIIGLAITLAVFAVLAAGYFLLGNISAKEAAAAPKATPSPVPEQASATTSPAPTATPYGVTAGSMIAGLRIDGILVEDTGDTFLINLPQEDPEDEIPATSRAELTLAFHHGSVTGFVLAFPVVEAAPKYDGSLITGALIERTAALNAAQADAMEQLFHAVFSCYDSMDQVPATMRSEWCAMYLALQAESAKKNHEDTYGHFRCAVYSHGAGDAMKLCCSVQYQ